MLRSHHLSNMPTERGKKHARFVVHPGPHELWTTRFCLLCFCLDAGKRAALASRRMAAQERALAAVAAAEADAAVEQGSKGTASRGSTEGGGQQEDCLVPAGLGTAPSATACGNSTPCLPCSGRDSPAAAECPARAPGSTLPLHDLPEGHTHELKPMPPPWMRKSKSSDVLVDNSATPFALQLASSPLLPSSKQQLPGRNSGSFSSHGSLMTRSRQSKQQEGVCSHSVCISGGQPEGKNLGCCMPPLSSSASKLPSATCAAAHSVSAPLPYVLQPKSSTSTTATAGFRALGSVQPPQDK
eukprot:1161898-Pelagomonas_calceolata.AAC.9